jgi:protein-S-isoprenylcysteine O-methyltransferase Ste14
MSNSFIGRGGMWVFGQFTILFLIVTLGITCHGQSKPLPVVLCGLAIIATSGMCGVFGAIALGRNLTPFPRPRSQTNLVQHGIYALIRHPLYTAVISAAVGWAFVWASWPALVASLVLAVFLDAKARREEQWLCGEFPEYAQYRQRVRKFLPWVY